MGRHVQGEVPGQGADESVVGKVPSQPVQQEQRGAGTPLEYLQIYARDFDDFLFHSHVSTWRDTGKRLGKREKIRPLVPLLVA